MNKSFDQWLLMKKGVAQYRLDKSKAGRSGSSAGQPRPYARKNIAIARLYSPKMVGQSFTVTPKAPHLKFGPGVYYTWTMTKPGVGVIEDIEITADEITNYFIIKK